MQDYWDEFTPFFWAMCKAMATNYFRKGDSWKSTCSEAYLLDKRNSQFEDMQNDPDREDYDVNIANYCAMLWLRELRGFDTSARDE